ncbi:MAG: class I SAM-dependent methyltransferase, partial [Anaerolineaceae bacterium]
MNYDELADAYSQNRKIHPVVLQNLLETARLTPTSAVLEVGCGTGNYILAIQASTGCAGEGIDPSVKMLEAAAS